MTASGDRIRSRRSGVVVAVTHAASPAGRAVASALARRAAPGPPAPSGAVHVRQVLALDDEPVDIPGVTWRTGPIADPAVARALEGADVVVHVACPTDLEAALASGSARRALALLGMQAVATAAAAVGARRLVVITSAMVFGARADNPEVLPDDAAGRAPSDDGLVGDLLAIEAIAERVPHLQPGLSVALMRPAALVGEGVDTVITRHFEAPVLLTVRGASEHWQFCSLDDLGEAIATVAAAGLTGALTVASPGALSRDEVVREAGMRTLDLPSAMAFASAQRLGRLGVLRMPPADLAYVVHPWTVGSTRLREAGWVAAHDNAWCLQHLLAQARARQASAARRPGRRDIALGAAGAAVAVMGAAAVMRQARSRGVRKGGSAHPKLPG